MSCKKEQQVLLDILHKYRDMPLLWQREHEHYLNKGLRAQCYKVLLKMYKNYNGKVTMKHMKKKIENMRTTYLKELKKVLASKYTGSGTNKVHSHIPTLWYYNALKFLSNDAECGHNVTVTDSYESLVRDSSSDDETLASVAISNCSRRKRKSMDTQLLYEENKVKYSTETDMAHDDEEFELHGRQVQCSKETNKSHDEEFENNGCKVTYSVETNTSHNDEEFDVYGRKNQCSKETNRSHEDELEEYGRKVKYSIETQTNNDEEYKVYGHSIGFQMKDLNKRQLMISQKIISDVLYYAKLDQLSEYTCLVLEPVNEPLLPNITKFYSMK